MVQATATVKESGGDLAYTGVNLGLGLGGLLLVFGGAAVLVVRRRTS